MIFKSVKSLFSKKSTDKELKSLQKKLTSLALEIANSYEIKLNFSHNSIQNIEEILTIIHKDYKKTKDESGLNGIALECAAYIITTMEKNGIKGIWSKDHETFGQNAFPYYLNKDEVIFPYSWCQKRIFDGPGDDIWSKYKNLVLNKNL